MNKIYQIWASIQKEKRSILAFDSEDRQSMGKNVLLFTIKL